VAHAHREAGRPLAPGRPHRRNGERGEQCLTLSIAF
jgi:hypothetical protein